MLNYGYAIVYPRVLQAILRAGLNPGIGVLHTFQKDKPTLAFDLIEIFRSQAVDRVVISMVQKREPIGMDKGLLNESTKKLLIQNILERLNKYEKFRSKEVPFISIIGIQAKEITSFIMNQNKSFKPYIFKW